MATLPLELLKIPGELLAAIEAIPTARRTSHCGHEFQVAPFDIYAACPRCGSRLKVRGFSGAAELEDVFDAVFAWMARPGNATLAIRQVEEIAADG